MVSYTILNWNSKFSCEKTDIDQKASIANFASVVISCGKYDILFFVIYENFNTLIDLEIHCNVFPSGPNRSWSALSLSLSPPE